MTKLQEEKMADENSVKELGNSVKELLDKVYSLTRRTTTLAVDEGTARAWLFHTLTLARRCGERELRYDTPLVVLGVVLEDADGATWTPCRLLQASQARSPDRPILSGAQTPVSASAAQEPVQWACDVHVEVSGREGSGKTHVVAAIIKALDSLGVRVRRGPGFGDRELASRIRHLDAGAIAKDGSTAEIRETVYKTR